MRGMGKFWGKRAWETWADDRRLWRSYKSAVNDLDRRAAVIRAGLAYSQQQAASAQRRLGWVEDIRPRAFPVDLKRNETGLASVHEVTLLEMRRREGQNVWVPIATGSVIFTDRRAIFDGPKNVSFEYRDLTGTTLGPRGLHISVSRRRTSHLLAGPAEQLEAILSACRSLALGADPLERAREAERAAVEAVAIDQANLSDLAQARAAIRRPARPWSPAWVPGAVVTVALLLTSGVAGADQQSTIPSLPTTAMAAATTTSTRATTTTETTAPTLADLRPETATVASITDGDTIRVVLADGSNEPVRLIGIDAPEFAELFSAEATALMVSLVEGQQVYLVPDESDRDRFDRLLRYVYVGETFINEEMVESGLAVAKEYRPDTAHSDVLTRAQARAEAENAGLWGITTTTVPATTTTAAPTTTTTLPPTTTTVAPTTTTAAPPTTTAAPAPNCHPAYSSPCVPAGVSDVDCAGGSGNGPYYINGPVYLSGSSDPYGLDGNDNDGIGCES